MSIQSRLLRWDACQNARDIGGYPTTDGGSTRWGAIFRSDNLSRLTLAGRDAMRAAGVRTIVDVRSPYELDIDPPPFRSSTTIGYLNLVLFTATAAEAVGDVPDMTDRYCLIADATRTEMATIMRAIAQAPEGGVLVHCHSGKDRTGMVIALLLDLAGVPRDMIAADYALSAQALQSIRDRQLSAATTDQQRQHIRDELSCPPERILLMLQHIDEKYGGTQRYLLSSAVSSGELQQLRTRLVAS